jgi:hypothetical protein
MGTATDDFRRLMTARTLAPRPGLAYPFSGNAKSLVLDSDPDSAVPSINTAKMCASVVISTPTPDRSEDVMEPLGVVLDNYRRNPVVYLDHGFYLPTPVAKSEDREGNLSVTVLDDRIEATSYFDASIPESAQVFDLIAANFLRSASINFTPLEAEYRTADVTDRGRPGMHITSWELLEWSWVGIPDNPEAVVKLLEKNRLAGRPIADSIRKSLARFVPEKVPQGRGWSPAKSNTKPEADAVAKIKFTKQQIRKMAPDIRKAVGEQVDEETAKAMEEVAAEEEAAKAKKGKKTADGAMPEDEAKAEGDEEPVVDGQAEGDSEPTETTDSGEMPLGAQRLGELHGMLAAMEQQCRAAAGPIENVPVKEAMLAMCDSLAGMTEEASSLYASTYPDQPGLKSEGAADSGNTEESPVAKFLAGASANRLPLAGLTAKIKSLSDAKGIPQVHRLTLKSVAGGLGRILSAASKSAAAAGAGETKGKKSDGADADAALQKAVDGLSAAVAKMSEAIPAPKK